MAYVQGFDQLNISNYFVLYHIKHICMYFSLLGAMFPLPRIIYAMASDGLMFQFMGNISGRFQTPLIGTLIAGLFTGKMNCIFGILSCENMLILFVMNTGTMAAIFQLDQLINMMSIGTLMAYSMVASCVLILRF